jgi:hypothetical protein
MNRKFILGIVMLVFMIGSASAVTPAKIIASVQNGTAWLAAQQNADGSWSHDVGITGLAVLKFEEYAKELGKSPFDPGYQYNANVTNGLNFIFRNIATKAISVQTNGNPDSNGNGKGIAVVSAYNGEEDYSNGIILMALTANNDSTRLVNDAASPVNGSTYMQVAQDMVDYLAFAQVDSGAGEGGWEYNACNNCSGSGDNSVGGWVSLGLGYANSNFGIATPGFVKTELNKYIDYIQSADGGSGYSGPNSMVNTYKTGTLLYQMKMVGDTASTPRVMNATNYIERHWNDLDQDPGWRDFVGSGTSNYQATFSLMKGFEVFGIKQINVSANHTLDWFDDMATEIVNEQHADGHWEGSEYGYYFPALDTVWALLTIEKAVTGPQPQCSDGIDNDGDGLIDMADPGCTDPSDNSEVNAGQPQCSDGIDNDGDGLIDMADPGCTDATDNSEANGQSIIEFPSVAFPVLLVIGLMVLLNRKKK